jgi:hypothetical protein
MKRKPGKSIQDLVDYYENVHCKIGECFLKGVAVRYLRRYLHPMLDPLADAGTPPSRNSMSRWRCGLRRTPTGRG